MNGRSFKSLLHGGAYEPHEAIFIERNFHGPFDPVRCVRTCDYHYMRNYHPQAIDYYPLPFELPADYRDEDKDSLPVKPRPEEELYHVRTDPMEFLNVAERPEHAGVKADLVGRMAQWMRDTDDFMLRGEVPQPHAEEGFLGWNPIDTIGSGKRQDTPIATPE
jgi:N-sulfoglucosamine sulfohydrolase